MLEYRGYKVKETTAIGAFDDPRKIEGPTYREFYEKTEVGKILAEKEMEIAELKEKHKTEVKELLCLIRDKENNFNRAFDSEEKEIRHQKCKRCLDKAKWCASEEGRLEAIAPLFGTNKECWEYSSDYWAKWRERWLRIAEEFKEASDA